VRPEQQKVLIEALDETRVTEARPKLSDAQRHVLGLVKKARKGRWEFSSDSADNPHNVRRSTVTALVKKGLLKRLGSKESREALPTGSFGRGGFRHDVRYVSIYGLTPEGEALTESLAEAKDRPLTDLEKRDFGKVAIWAMDVEMDGGTVPDRIDKLLDRSRHLSPKETREVLKWYYSTAPGNY
jgi:hypothetical protein